MKSTTTLFVLLFAFILSSTVVSFAANDPAASPSGPYFAGDQYDQSIPKPSDYFGFPLGSKPASHAQFSGYLKLLAESSPRAQLHEYGETYENHELYYLIVSSEQNMARLDEIKASINRLADPRKTSSSDADRLIANNPAIAWAGYAIHGDELSSVDASIAVAYQLVAGTDPQTMNTLDNLIVLIDPSENPDGRERFLTQVRAFTGNVPNPDLQNMLHSGAWPGGRGNHYFIDLNRDTFTLVYPETKAKMAVWIDWHPQLMIDSHEMGPLDTYLFSPPRAPFNPHWPEGIRFWWAKFASDQAEALDKYGWQYFTREWNEEWFPGYTSSWGVFGGAVGILYEQAGVDGGQVKQFTGKVLEYSETVHHHFVSSIANLSTAASSKAELLRSYYNVRREAVANKKDVLGQEFIVDRAQNPARVDKLMEVLSRQGIEVRKANAAFKASGLKNEYGPAGQKDFSVDTYIIDFAQPSRYLIQVLLDYDIRIPNSFLQEERRWLEKGWGSRMYDVSAWSMPLAYGLETYISDKKANVSTTAVTEFKKDKGGIENDRPLYGFMVDNSGDGVIRLLADCLGLGFNIRVSHEATYIEKLNFKKGSLLFVKNENPDNMKDVLSSLAEKYGLTVYGINTALASDGPDLGGDEFNLLTMPKVAIIGGPNISTSVYGQFWHLFDRELEMRVSTLDINRLGWTDLSKYNVIVFPSPWGGSGMLKSVLGDGGIAKLKDWVENGGTLVTMGNSTAFCVDSSVGLSSMVLRRDALEKLADYDYAVGLEAAADNIVIDSLRVWEAKEPKKEEKKEEKAPPPSKEDLQRQDEFARIFRPDGVILDCKIDTTEWLSYGIGPSLPVILFSDEAYLSKPPTKTIARFKDESHIRLSGLAWPETRTRYANSAYCVREGRGRGQVILFASNPFLRSYFHGSNRMFLNAVLLGPGLGTRQSLPY